MYKVIISTFLVCLLFLSACNFKPLYSSNNYDDTKASIEGIKFTTPNSINGYVMKDHLQSYARPNKKSSHYQYDLIVEIILREIEIAKSSTGVAARKQLIVDVPYKLICISNKKILKSNTITSRSSYDISGTPFANTVNDDQLRNKIMQELAHDLYWQIIEIFENENTNCKNT